MVLSAQWLTKVKNFPINPALPSWLAIAGGRHIHVAPVSGSDSGREGKSPDKAVKTLAKALSLATANQNDIVFFHSEGNAAAYCTDYQSAQLDWNKDGVHLIGVNSGVSISPRSRIAPAAAYNNAAPIFLVSASNCYIAGIQVIMGVAGTLPLGAMSVTGQRNRFDRCHIYGFGNAANDIAGAYSLLLSGAEENEFNGCTIGSDRIACGAQANSQLKCAATAKNNRFVDCTFKLVSTHATNHVFVRCATGSLDGALEFIRTRGFNSQSRNVAGLELTQAMVIASDAGGDVFLDPSSAFQGADVNSTDAGNVYAAGAAAGILVPVTR